MYSSAEELTGILQIVGDSYTAIGRGFVGEELLELVHLVGADRLASELRKPPPDLNGSQLRGRDVEVVALVFEQSEGEFPEVVRSDARNLVREALIHTMYSGHEVTHS